MRSKQPNTLRLGIESKGDHGEKSEKRLSLAMRARQTPASGAMRGAKGDFHVRGNVDLMMEAKSTVNGSLSVDLGWLVKVSEEAMAVGKLPALTMSFVRPDGKSKPHGDWVAVPLHVFKELLGDVAD